MVVRHGSVVTGCSQWAVDRLGDLPVVAPLLNKLPAALFRPVGISWQPQPVVRHRPFFQGGIAVSPEPSSLTTMLPKF